MNDSSSPMINEADLSGLEARGVYLQVEIYSKDYNRNILIPFHLLFQKDCCAIRCWNFPWQFNAQWTLYCLMRNINPTLYAPKF